MITPLFVMFRKTILTQEVTMDFYFLINCSTSLYNGPNKLKTTCIRGNVEVPTQKHSEEDASGLYFYIMQKSFKCQEHHD